MKILITGGAGYLGSTLVPLLLANGHDVTVLDNFLHGQATALAACCGHPKLDIHRGDARDMRVVNPLLKHADVVIPLAAIVGAPACDRDVYGAVSTNQHAVEDLCKFASDSQLVVIPNTNSGYGKGDLCTEESPLNPVSLYGVTKVAAESAVMARKNSVSLRLATVFGASPRMRTDLMVNEFVWRAATDGVIVLFEAHHRRNFIHVRDVATAFLCAVHYGEMIGNVYNVGDSAANMTKSELAAIVAVATGCKLMEVDTARDPDQRDYLVSNAKIEATGWKPQYSINDGVGELVKLYKCFDRFQWGNV